MRTSSAPPLGESSKSFSDPPHHEDGRVEPQVKVISDLHRLARFGANLSDSHSCLIFLPAHLLATLCCTPPPPGREEARSLVLGGYHSLSKDIVQDCRLPGESGLIGWVAKHQRPVHASPFELDSRTLGIYSSDQELKSFIGIPVALKESIGTAGHSNTGVIACDSRKSYAFSKLHIKLLENLAAEVANTLELLLLYGGQGQADVAWQTFLRKSQDLIAGLGIQSVEILRVRISNFQSLEASLGTTACLALVEQIYRLLQQALPPHWPMARLLSGDILVCLDVMTSSFYESKIRALADHVTPSGPRPVFEFIRSSSKDKKKRALDLEALVRETARPTLTDGSVVRLEKEVGYEYRRA